MKKTIDQEIIKNKIYAIRNKQVMLDLDLAQIYGYSVKRFNEQVKRNLEKFDGEDFMFQLNENDINCLSRSKITTSIMQNKGDKGGRAYYPYAFTEQGIYMLMTVLKGDLATKQSRMLIRMFKTMKDYIINNQSLIRHDEALSLALTNSKRIDSIENKMADKNDLYDINKRLDIMNANFINSDNIKSFIIESNTKFEADEFYKKLFKKANTSIVIIDNYINSKVLELLSYAKENINIKIITNKANRTRDNLKKCQFDDFVKEYPKYSISLIDSNNEIHDRFIIIDYKTSKQKTYISGSSIKDTGNKLSAVIELQDITLPEELINIIENGNIFEW